MVKVVGVLLAIFGAIGSLSIAETGGGLRLLYVTVVAVVTLVSGIYVARNAKNIAFAQKFKVLGLILATMRVVNFLWHFLSLNDRIDLATAAGMISAHAIVFILSILLVVGGMRLRNS